MRLTPLKQALPNKRLAQQKLHILLRPIPCRKRLQKHHDLLEIHLTELVGPFDQERGADVEVEGGETLVFGLD